MRPSEPVSGVPALGALIRSAMAWSMNDRLTTPATVERGASVPVHR